MVHRPHVIGFAILFVCLTALVGVTGDVPTSEATATPSAEMDAVDAQESLDVQESVDGFSRATFTLTVYENGSVRWMETYARPLNESEVQEFDAYAEEFNTTDTELYREFVADAKSLASIGSRSTNRTMQARNFQKRAYIDQDGYNLGIQGKAEMSFLWTNLSRVESGRVILGEVFDVGLYVGPNQRLMIQSGPRLVFSTVDPEPDSQNDPDSLADSEWVIWQGEYEFAPERPLVRFQPADTAVTTTQTIVATPTTITTTAPDRPTTTTPASGDGGNEGLFVVALIVLLLAVGTAAVYRTLASTD
jgi:hypothetical protein